MIEYLPKTSEQLLTIIYSVGIGFALGLFYEFLKISQHIKQIEPFFGNHIIPSIMPLQDKIAFKEFLYVEQ